MAPVTDPNNAHSTRKEMCLHLISEYQINSLKQNMITCLTMITFQLTVNFCKFYVLRMIDGALVSIYLKFIAVSKIQNFEKRIDFWKLLTYSMATFTKIENSLKNIELVKKRLFNISFLNW